MFLRVPELDVQDQGPADAIPRKGLPPGLRMDPFSLFLSKQRRQACSLVSSQAEGQGADPITRALPALSDSSLQSLTSKQHRTGMKASTWESWGGEGEGGAA